MDSRSACSVSEAAIAKCRFGITLKSARLKTVAEFIRRIVLVYMNAQYQATYFF